MINNLTKKIIAGSLIFCIALLSLAVMYNAIAPSNGAIKYDYTIVIDAGHGGVDCGVVGVKTGIKESDVNLSLTYILKDILETGGFKVVLTRSDKNGLYGSLDTGFKKRDMMRRREIITKASADMVLSIHMNKFALSSRRGPQVFFDKESSSSEKLACSLQSVLNSFTGFSHSALSGKYFMLNCSKSPSVIVECGFMSNPVDENLLITKDYQRQIANKIFDGILLFLTDNAPQELY